MTPNLMNKILTSGLPFNYFDPNEYANARRELIARGVASFEDEEEFLNEYLALYHFDPLSEIFKFRGVDGADHEFTVLPPTVQQERSQVTKRMQNKILESELQILDSRAEILKHPYKQRAGANRDFVQFFGDNVPPSRPELRGSVVANKLSDPNIPGEEKQRLFDEYLTDRIKLTENAMEYSNDEEFIERFPKMRTAAMGFAMDGMDNCFRQLAGVELNPELVKKYNNAREHFQGALNYIVSKASYIADPAYKYFDEETMMKVGEYQNEDEEHAMNCPHYFYSANNIYSSAVLGGTAMQMNDIKHLSKEKNAFEIMKYAGKVSEDSEFYDKFGTHLTYEDANLLLSNRQPIGVISKDGTMKTFEQKPDFKIRENDVGDLKEDNRMRYAHMLDILNRGTTRFNISSKSYKNMRNILDKLSKGQGNEAELLESLELNARNYMERYNNKSKVSKLAYKRKQCVEEMKRELDEIKNVGKFGDLLRQKKAAIERKKARENGDLNPHRKKIERFVSNEILEESESSVDEDEMDLMPKKKGNKALKEANIQDEDDGKLKNKKQLILDDENELNTSMDNVEKEDEGVSITLNEKDEEIDAPTRDK